MAVDMNTAPKFERRAPRVFQTHTALDGNLRQYISPMMYLDGNRFLVLNEMGEQASDSFAITVVVNWTPD